MMLLKISLVGIETEPKFTFKTKQVINPRIRIKNDHLYVLDEGNYCKGLKKYGSYS